MQIAEVITYNNGFFVLYNYTNDGKDRSVAAILPGFSTVILPGRNDEEIEFRNGQYSYFAHGRNKTDRDAYLLSLAAFVTAPSTSETSQQQQQPEPAAPLEEHKPTINVVQLEEHKPTNNNMMPQRVEILPTIPMVTVTAEERAEVAKILAKAAKTDDTEL